MRVDTKQDPHQLFSHASVFRPHSDISSRFRTFQKAYQALLSRKTEIKGTEYRTFVQGCSRCLAVTPCHDYSYLDLRPLYADYRSETYNRDRIAVEPSYAQIAALVGNSPVEITTRNRAVDLFLGRHRPSFLLGEALDFGGSDGRFLPSTVLDFFPRVDICDLSDAPIHPSVPVEKVRKIATPREGAYSFVMCMHVLEHVGNPRQFVEHLIKYITPGGFVYIEVPLELSENLRCQFILGNTGSPYRIHEHLNRFDLVSMTKLIDTFDSLDLVDAMADPIDIGWVRGVVGRYLVRKNF